MPHQQGFQVNLRPHLNCEGVVFLIHRGEEYIGKVRVTTVWNDFSGGQIIEIPNPKKPIMTGDDAMTSTKG